MLDEDVEIGKGEDDCSGTARPLPAPVLYDDLRCRPGSAVPRRARRGPAAGPSRTIRAARGG